MINFNPLISFPNSRNGGVAISLSKFTTKFFADSVEWCPGSNLIACGNYQLEEQSVEKEKASRQGCIYLIEAQKDHSLVVRDQVETRGILDQKWFDGKHLGVVTSIGELIVYDLDDEKKKLREKSKVLLDESEEIIALSLDHFEKKTLVSDSMGKINLFSSDMEKEQTFTGHGFEAWTCAFDRHDSNILYSGELKYFSSFLIQITLIHLSL